MTAGSLLPTLSNVCVILVEPIHAGNIGAVARAMKNYGVKDLRLVNPRNHLSEEAMKLAQHSEELLHNAQLFTSLKDALVNVHWSVGTTARKRSHHIPTYVPRDIATQSAGFDKDHRIGLVFGREDNGLYNEELNLCRVISTIPTYSDHSSINLAQSVTIHLYEIFQARLTANPAYYWDYASPEEVEILFSRIERVLVAVGFEPRKTLDDFMIGVKRVLNRTPLEDRDVRIWHMVFKEIETYIRHMGNG